MSKPRRHAHLSRALFVSIAALSLAATGAVASVAGSSMLDRSSTAPQVSFPPPIPVVPPSVTPLPAPMTRQQAIDSVRSRGNVVMRIDRVAAKQTSFGAVQEARGAATDVIANASPSLVVWVVAVSGDFRPQLARGERFPWGVVLLDVITGREVATFAGGGGPWPDFFDKLRDRAGS